MNFPVSWICLRKISTSLMQNLFSIHLVLTVNYQYNNMRKWQGYQLKINLMETKDSKRYSAIAEYLLSAWGDSFMSL